MAFMNLFKKKESEKGAEIAPPPRSAAPASGSSVPQAPSGSYSQDFPPPPPAFGDGPPAPKAPTPRSYSSSNIPPPQAPPELPKLDIETPPPFDPSGLDGDAMNDAPDIPVPPPSKASAPRPSKSGQRSYSNESAFDQTPLGGDEDISPIDTSSGDASSQTFTGFNKPEFEPPPPMEEPSVPGSDDEIPDDLFSEILGGSQPPPDLETNEIEMPDPEPVPAPPSDHPTYNDENPFAEAPESDMVESEDDPGMMQELEQQEVPEPEPVRKRPMTPSEVIDLDLSTIDTSQPLFVSAQSYSDILKDVNDLTSQIKKFEETFARIYDFKIQQNDDFENWRKLLEFLHKKLTVVDNTLYAPKGEKE